MKRSLYIISMALVALLLGSCTAMMSASTYGSNDLYVTDNRIRVAEQLRVEAEADRAAAEARKAQWEALAAEAAYYDVVSGGYDSYYADDYESAYARRLRGFNSPTYRLPSSYYDLATSSAMRYATAYDPAFYNIMVSGNEVWVEPKYVTSMFGSWGATNITFGIYSSPWNYGWNYAVNPFYYSCWGYPHYSWYDWHWNMCCNPYHYDPYWGYGYYHGHYPHYPVYHPNHHHSPGYRPGPPPHKPQNPVHRPSIVGGGRSQSAGRYMTPSGGRNYNGDSSGVRVRPGNTGSTSSGANGRYRPGSSSGGYNQNRGTVGGSNSGSRSYGSGGSGSSQQRSSNFRERSHGTSGSSGSLTNYRGSSVGSSSSRSSGSYSGGGSSGGSRSSGSSGGTTSSRR